MTRLTGLRLTSSPLVRHVSLAIVGAVFFYFLTSSLSPFHDYEVGLIALYTIAVAGLSLLTGVNGQISLGHGAFMATGAYTFAYIQAHASVPLAVQLIAAVVASAVLGVIVGVPATRLSGPYLAGMTLVLALGLPQLGDKYTSLFGGNEGLHPNPLVNPASVNPDRWLAWIQIICALVTLVLLANLVRSHFGRSMRAVRDGEIAASLAGIHVARTKVLTFAISSACAGLAGALLAISTGVVDPGEFELTLSIYLLAAMVLGGAGSLGGAWWGGILIVFLPEWSTSLSRSFSLGGSVSASLAVVIYGLVLIVVMMVAPTGIQGGLRWLGRRALALAGARPSPITPVATSPGLGAAPPLSTVPTSESERTLP
ncbi:MAG: branched-chain amino acid ABC transporter permease [Acidimicrobiales bacterium]